MLLEHITYTGPDFEFSSAVVGMIPENLIAILKQINGFIQFGGGLHLRGVCTTPEWHSIEKIMCGDGALYKNYATVKSTDIPFAQDCMGDQFILRDRVVYKLYGETGELDCMQLTLADFFERIQNDPVEFLQMSPLLEFQKSDRSLNPGELLNAYPPFCTKESANGVSLRAVPVDEQLAFLADFSKSISDVESGGSIVVKETLKKLPEMR